jgi:hypothetical protein
MHERDIFTIFTMLQSFSNSFTFKLLDAYLTKNRTDTCCIIFLPHKRYYKFIREFNYEKPYGKIELIVLFGNKIQKEKKLLGLNGSGAKYLTLFYSRDNASSVTAFRV